MSGLKLKLPPVLPSPVSGISTPARSTAQPRKNASVACQACKASRAKCSGEVPCDSCVARDIECVIQTQNDKRRKESRKRAIDSLQDDSELLSDLLHVLRQSEGDQLVEVVSLIREKASVAEVKARIRRQLLGNRWLRRESSPELKEAFNQAEAVSSDSSSSRHSKAMDISRLMDITRLTDNPPHRVPASPWTNVTGDELLVSHLVSMWFTWSNCFYVWIDQEIFLRDMRLGRIGAKHCSAFLVNALLAWACLTSDYKEARAQRGAASELMLNFIEEAERLMLEDETPSITKAQGLTLLCMTQYCMGRDNVCIEYWRQAIAMIKGLETQHSTDRQTQEMSRTSEGCCWALFHLACVGSLSWDTGMSCQPPSIPMPHPMKENPAWIPYPRGDKNFASYVGECHYHFARLSLVAKDITNDLYCVRQNGWDQEKQVTASKEQRKRLDDWRRSLPSYLMPGLTAVPHILILHCYYLLLSLKLSPLARDKPQPRNKGSRMNLPHAECEAALEIVQICRLHQSAWGSQHMNMFYVQPIKLALYALVNEAQTYADEIWGLCDLLRTLARRWPCAMVVLRRFHLLTSQFGGRLPPKIKDVLEGFERSEWDARTSDGVDSDTAGGADRRRETREANELFDATETLDIDRMRQEEGKTQARPVDL